MLERFNRLARVRFSLRDLFYVCALLAVGFTWPILLVFVVPIILAAILARMGFGLAVPVVIAAGLAIVAGAAISFGVWRYPFYPPRILPELRNIKTLHQLSYVTGLNVQQGSLPSIGAVTAIPPASALQWNAPGELKPTQRLLDHFGRHDLSIQSAKPLQAELLASMWRAVDEVGLLLDGQPDRENTKTLAGYIGTATLSDGIEILFASVEGDEYSNDHYPYYEWVFKHGPHGLVLVNEQWFFFDIAGIEGFNWKHAAVFAFLVLCPPVCLIWWMLERKTRGNESTSGDKSS